MKGNHQRRLKTIPVWALILVLSMLANACSLTGQRTPAANQTQPTAVQPAAPATPSPAPTATRQPLPPALIETDPPSGSQFDPALGIKLYFDQPVTAESFEAALSIEPTLQVSLTWNDARDQVTLRPTESWTPGQRYALTLTGGLTSAVNALTQNESVQFFYTAPQELRVIEQIPGDLSSEINPSAAVAVTFNQAVVPLGGDPTGQPPALVLDPPVSGRGEWINTATYVFYPDPPLAGGISYTAKISEALKSPSGGSLAADSPRSWSFKTRPPQLLSITPEATQNLFLEEDIQLTFNQPIDRASLEKNFILADSNEARVPGKFTWSDDSTQVTFHHAIPFARETAYLLRLDGGTRSAGGTPLGKDISRSYRTVGSLRVIATNPERGKPIVVYGGGYGSIELRFSQPLTKGDLSRWFEIQPKPGDFAVYQGGEESSAFISGFFEPSTSYQLIINPRITDRWGGAISGETNLNFFTGPAIPELLIPAMYGQSGSSFLPAGSFGLNARATNVTTLTTRAETLTLEAFLMRQQAYNAGAEQPLIGENANTWTQPLNIRMNESSSVQIQLTEDGRSPAPGLYYYEISAPEFAQEGSSYPPYFFTVISSTALEMKRSRTEMTVWAISLVNQSPLAGAEISVYDDQQTLIQTCQTDEKGLCSVPVDGGNYERHYFAVIGQPGQANFALSMENWTSGLSVWSSGYNFELQSDKRQLYLYTDRPIYRPGQTVSYRALLRYKDNGRYLLPEEEDIQLQIFGSYQPDTGITPLLNDLTLPLNEFGSAAGSFVLPENAEPGYYNIQSPDPIQGGYLSFQVADYRKPDIELSVTFKPEEGLLSDVRSALINARYYFGAPGKDLNLHWTLYAGPTQARLPEGFTSGGSIARMFSRYPRFNSSLGVYITEGTGKTGPGGQFELSLPLDQIQRQIEDPGQPVQLTLEVTVEDAGGRPVSARQTARIHLSPIYAGLKLDSWMAAANQAFGAAVLSVDWQGNVTGNQPVKVAFDHVAWKIDENGLETDPILTSEPVSSIDLVTDARGRARVEFTPPEPGMYRLQLISGTAVTEKLIWAAGEGAAFWPQLTERRIQLTADAGSYQPGQTAQVFVPNPFPGEVTALVTIEREKVMRSRIEKFSGAGKTLDIPLEEMDAPNVYVTVTLVGKRADGRADFRHGILKLKVAPAALQLNVQLTPSTDRALPGSTVKYTLQVTDQNGQPVQGEFSVAIVDKAALALADPNSVSIMDAYYGEQPLGVQSSFSLAAYSDGPVRRPIGGGGGGGDTQQISQVRDRFLDTALWQGDLRTDAEGKATVEITLPDNLTTWTAWVRGLDKDTRVGEATVDIEAAKDLIIRPLTPRYFTAGDHVQLRAEVHNNTTTAQKTNVRLDALGFTLDDAAQMAQNIQLEAGAMQVVTWWGTVQDSDSVDLVFSARTDSLEDAARPEDSPLPVLHYITPETFRTSGILASESSRFETIHLPRSFTPQGGKVSVELAPSLAAVAINGLSTLEDGENDYTEAILNRLLPRLSVYNAVRTAGWQQPGLEEQLRGAVQNGLDRLMRLQKTDGSWGWGTGPNGDLKITAAALSVMGQARQSGFDIAEPNLIRARDFLSAGYLPANQLAGRVELERAVWMVYGLQRAGFADFSPLPLVSRAQEMDPWARALLAASVQISDPSDPAARDLVEQLKTSAVRSANGAHWEGTGREYSLIFNTAVVLNTLAQIDPASPLAAEAAQYLAVSRRGKGSWGGWRDTAWSITALTAAAQGVGGWQADYSYSASLNGQNLAAGDTAEPLTLTTVTAFAPLSQLAADRANILAVERSAGTGNLFYTLGLEIYRPVDEARPIQRGLTLTRSYRIAGKDCSREECPSINTLALNGNAAVQVRINLTVPESQGTVVVEDFIPAGLEALNPSLKTSQQGQPVEFQRDLYHDGWGWWYFGAPVMYGDRVRWTAERLPAGTYQLVYTLAPVQAGEYHVLPARAYALDFPEIQGSSAGGMIKITP